MDVGPKFRCKSCTRSVLNRDFPRCLYCGADLPPEALLPAEEITRRDSARANLSMAKPMEQVGRAGDIADGLGVVAELVDMVADGISALGDMAG